MVTEGQRRGIHGADNHHSIESVKGSARPKPSWLPWRKSLLNESEWRSSYLSLARWPTR